MSLLWDARLKRVINKNLPHFGYNNYDENDVKQLFVTFTDNNFYIENVCILSAKIKAIGQFGRSIHEI